MLLIPQKNQIDIAADTSGFFFKEYNIRASRIRQIEKSRKCLKQFGNYD